MDGFTFGGETKENQFERNKLTSNALSKRKLSINVKKYLQNNGRVQDNSFNSNSACDSESKQIVNIPRLYEITKKIQIMKISRFLVEKTRARMLKKMDALKYEFINDKCQDFSDLLKGKKNSFSFLSIKQQKLFNFKKIHFFIKIFSSLPVFSPQNSFKIFWDICFQLMLLYSFFIISIIVSFSLNNNSIEREQTVEYILLTNIIDIIIQCSTSFYKRGILCKKRSSIWRKYYQEQFFTDAYSLLPLLIYNIIEESLDENNFKFIMLSILIKWRSFSNLYKNIQQRFLLQSNIRNILSLLNLFFKILMIAHACACLWIICGRLSIYYYDVSWIQNQNLQNSTWQNQYLVAVYFCSVTMATVGYGDISPQSILERGFCIIMVFFASAVFGFAVNTIQIILQDFSKNEKFLVQNLFIIKKYLHKKQINDNLSKDITEYLEYYLKANKQSNQQQEENLIKQLPDSLRNDLLIESNKIVLRDCKIFQNYFTEDVIKAIIPIIKEQHYTPNEQIDTEGESNEDQCIYFVQEGIIEMYIDSTNYFDEKVEVKNSFKTIKIFKKGDCFGELQFFINENKGMNLRSVNFSTLLKIQRKEFIQILKKFPQDYEQFCYIKDSLIMQQNYQKLFQKCPSCQDSNHLLETCPYLHYYPSKYKIFAKYRISSDQIRNGQILERSIKRNQININFNEEVAYEYLEFNQEYLHGYSEKYLQYNISKCDMCILFHKHQAQNIKHKETQNQLEKNQLDPDVYLNQIQNGISSQNNLQQQNNIQNFKKVEKEPNQINNISTVSLTQINDDSGLQSKFIKMKRFYTKQQNSKSIENIDQIEIQSAKYIKSQPSQPKQRQVKKSFENLPKSGINSISFYGGFYNQSMNSNTMIQQKNGSSHKILSILQPLTEVKNSFYEQTLPGNLSPSILAINNGMQESAKKIKNNLSQSLIQEKDKSVANQNEQQHIQSIFFDPFLGQFEKMKLFQLYYPLNNYNFVIMLTRQDPIQRNKLKAELLEIQRQKLCKITESKQLRNLKLRNQSGKQNQIIKKLLDKIVDKGKTNTFQSFEEQHSLQILSNQNVLIRKNRDSLIRTGSNKSIQKDNNIDSNNNTNYKRRHSLFYKQTSQQNEDDQIQTSQNKINQNEQISQQQVTYDQSSEQKINTNFKVKNKEEQKNTQFCEINQAISQNTLNSSLQQEQSAMSFNCLRNTKFGVFQYNQNDNSIFFKD